MFLKSDLVCLRPLEEGDADFFVKHLNRWEVMKFLALYRPFSFTSEKEWIRGLDEKKADIILGIENSDGVLIGSVGLHNINHKDRHATFGIVIAHQDFQNKGLGPEAAKLIIDYGFQQLNLRRVNSSAIAFNHRSIKMHLGLGFKEEGRARQKFFKNGNYHDELLFGLLREEWKRLFSQE